VRENPAIEATGGRLETHFQKLCFAERRVGINAVAHSENRPASSTLAKGLLQSALDRANVSAVLRSKSINLLTGRFDAKHKASPGPENLNSNANHDKRQSCTIDPRAYVCPQTSAENKDACDESSNENPNAEENQKQSNSVHPPRVFYRYAADVGDLVSGLAQARHLAGDRNILG
jgi:hypothetical protein